MRINVLELVIEVKDEYNQVVQQGETFTIKVKGPLAPSPTGKSVFINFGSNVLTYWIGEEGESNGVDGYPNQDLCNGHVTLRDSNYDSALTRTNTSPSSIEMPLELNYNQDITDLNEQEECKVEIWVYTSTSNDP